MQLTFLVTERGQSLVQALADAGVFVLHDARGGHAFLNELFVSGHALLEEEIVNDGSFVHLNWISTLSRLNSSDVPRAE
jgi:hypothetical protein